MWEPVTLGEEGRLVVASDGILDPPCKRGLVGQKTTYHPLVRVPVGPAPLSALCTSATVMKARPGRRRVSCPISVRAERTAAASLEIQTTESLRDLRIVPDRAAHLDDDGEADAGDRNARQPFTEAIVKRAWRPWPAAETPSIIRGAFDALAAAAFPTSKPSAKSAWMALVAFVLCDEEEGLVAAGFWRSDESQAAAVPEIR
jgi:hypothetical protein